MKTLLFKCVAVAACAMAAISASSQTQTVDRKACQASYATTVSGCAKGLSFLEPKVRATTQAACVKGAQETRDTCLAGTGPAVCQASCQASYDITSSQCEAKFVVTIPLCFNDEVCVNFITSVRDQCLIGATTALDACVASCQITP